jgi:hypothetical protein
MIHQPSVPILEPFRREAREHAMRRGALHVGGEAQAGHIKRLEERIASEVGVV